MDAGDKFARVHPDAQRTSCGQGGEKSRKQGAPGTLLTTRHKPRAPWFYPVP